MATPAPAPTPAAAVPGHHRCRVCDAECTKKCGVCKATYYCSVEHQKSDWTTHKQTCGVVEMEPIVGQLSATLCVSMTEEPVQMSPMLLTEVAPPSAKMKRCYFSDNSPRVYSDESDGAELTPTQLRAMVAYRAPSLTLSSKDGEKFTYQASNGTHFTVGELMRDIADMETKTRGREENHWIGGIDVHHTFFEGVHGNYKTGFGVYWGS